MALFIQLLSAFLAICTTAILALIIRAGKRSLKFLRGPPSPSFLLGHEWDLTRMRKIGGLEYEWFEQYGSVFRLNGCFGEDILEIADPRALQHICHKSAYRYKKPMDIEQIVNKLFGPGLLTVNGNVHQRQRKIMNPIFSAAQIRPFAPVFEGCAQTVITKWKSEIEDGTTIIDCYRPLHGITLDALGEGTYANLKSELEAHPLYLPTAMFEYKFDSTGKTRANGLRDVMRELFIDSSNPTKLKVLRSASYRFLPRPIIDLISLRKTKEDKRFANWLSESQKVTERLINQKVESGGGQEKDKDILSVIARSLAAEDPSKRLVPVEALSQMATIILAGHETTASTLNWLLYELSYNPEWQDRLVQEIQDIRRQTGTNGPLTVKDLEGMRVLNATIKETLRFYPIVPELFRESDSDDIIPLECPITDISGSVLREIPVIKGQRVVLNIFKYNRLKTVWGEDADVWNPERFLESNRPTTLGVFANLMTFSGGIRACIGWRFALLELQVIAVALVESFEFSAVDGIEIEHVRVGTNPPMLKGRWKAGPQLPLKVALRSA
ncbi:hypothetical protein PM082_009253 [Marasmius tenuissimus]|nr:hypothetical protein PM082_009253 [Marasmius tenuissimus]